MRGSRSYLLNFVSIVALLILSLFVFTGASSKPRIIAIGDVHGAFDAFVDILQKSQVIDDKQKWVAENTILVQTGDIVDRGPDSRKVMDLLMSSKSKRLRKRAR